MSDNKPVVILVHGFTNNPTDFNLWTQELLKEQFVVYTIPYYKNDTVYEPIERYAEVLSNFIQEKDFTGELTLIGFSMGGLVIRYYLQNLYNQLKLVKNVFLVATPHYGSDLATIGAIGGLIGDLLSKLLRNKPMLDKSVSDTSITQFSPLSPFIHRLNTYTPKVHKNFKTINFVNIWLSKDIVISPAGNAIAPFEKIINREITTNLFHNLVLKHRGLQEILIDEIIPILKKQKRRRRKGPQTLEEWKNLEQKKRITQRRRSRVDEEK